MTKIFNEMHSHYHMGLSGLPSHVDDKSPQGQFWHLGDKHNNELKKLDNNNPDAELLEFSYLFDRLTKRHTNEFTCLMNKVRRRMNRASQYGGRRHNRS